MNVLLVIFGLISFICYVSEAKVRKCYACEGDCEKHTVVECEKENVENFKCVTTTIRLPPETKVTGIKECYNFITADLYCEKMRNISQVEGEDVEFTCRTCDTDLCNSEEIPSAAKIYTVSPVQLIGVLQFLICIV